MDETLALPPPRLVVRSQPEPDEGFQGWLLRLAESNGYRDTKAIRRSIGIGSRGGRERGKVLDNLRALTGLEAGRAAAILPHGIERGRATHAPLGMRVPSFLLDVTTSKVCPRCLADREVIPDAWTLKLWTCCPVHGCDLIDACPKCTQPLRWSRRGVNFCTDPECDHRPSMVTPKPALPATLAMVSLVADIVRGPGSKQGAMLPAVFESLADADKILMIARLVLKRGAAGEDVRGEDMERSAARALLLLRDWPHGFHEFVASQAPGNQFALKGEGGSDLRLFFNERSDRFGMPPSARRIFLDELIRFREERITEAPNPATKTALRGGSRWVGAAEAGKILGIHQRTVKRMVETGTLNGKVVSRDGRDLILIEKSIVESKLKSDMSKHAASKLRLEKQLLTLVEAGHALGVAPDTVHNLIASGHITTVIAGARRFITAASIKDLVQRLMDLVHIRRTDATGGSFEGETVDVRRVIDRRIEIGAFLADVLAGGARPVRIVEGAVGLKIFRFGLADVLDAAIRIRAASGYIPIVDAQRLLGTQASLRLVRDLVGDGFLHLAPGRGGILASSLEAFLRENAAARSLAVARRMRHRRVETVLSGAGLQPVASYRKWNGTETFWCLIDVERVLGPPKPYVAPKPRRRTLAPSVALPQLPQCPADDADVRGGDEVRPPPHCRP